MRKEKQLCAHTTERRAKYILATDFTGQFSTFKRTDNSYPT